MGGSNVDLSVKYCMTSAYITCGHCLVLHHLCHPANNNHLGFEYAFWHIRFIMSKVQRLYPIIYLLLRFKN